MLEGGHEITCYNHMLEADSRGARNRVTRSNYLLVGTRPAGPQVRLRVCEILRFQVFQTDRCSFFQIIKTELTSVSHDNN
jgi:hypothetical protein